MKKVVEIDETISDAYRSEIVYNWIRKHENMPKYLNKPINNDEELAEIILKEVEDVS